jgi:CHAD domain-containing protein
MPVDRDRNRLVVRRLSRVARHLTTSPSAEDVHRFRTNVRRVEAMVQWLGKKSEHDHKKLLKLLGRLRRRAGRVRDVDVQLATLRSLKLPEEARRKAQLQRALSDQRAKRERKLSQAVDKDTLRKLRKRLRKLESALAFPEDFDPSKAALQEFNELARQQGPLNEERLHQFRIAAKRVRYVAEMAGKDPEAKRIVSELRRLQTALGDWHDWSTLTASAEETFGSGVNNALLAALRSATRQKFREAVQALNESRPRMLAPPISVTASLRPAVSRPPSRSQRTSRTAVSDTRAVA